MGSNMYPETETWNPFVGCRHNCIYCEATFQRQLKRWAKKNCQKCDNYEPHTHPERLDRIPSSDIVLVAGSGDISFCPTDYVHKIIDSIKKHNKSCSYKTYYFQSKNPKTFERFMDDLPENAVLVSTLETDKVKFSDDSKYSDYSGAPNPVHRYKDFKDLDYPRKVVTVEPIMEFTDSFSDKLVSLDPEYIWIGFNSKPKEVSLPEPSEKQVKNLIRNLEKSNVEVRDKELRGLESWFNDRKEEGGKNSSNDIEQKALALLESPDLLQQIKEILDRGFIVDRYRAIVGEDENKLLTFLIGVSAKTDYPQFEWVKGQSGKGKTNLVSTVLHLFPEDYVKEMAHFTSGALRHSDDDYKILYLQEWKSDAEKDIRLTSGQDGGYSFEIAVKKDGRWTTEKKTIPAKTLITTSVEFNPTSQMQRRCWNLSVDESQELTDRINERKAEYHKGSIDPISEERLQVVRRAIELLKSREVIIPYAGRVNDLLRWNRTHFDFFCELIKVICILHQRRRYVDKERKLVATSEDFRHALRIVWPNILAETLLNIPNRLRGYVEALRELEESSAKDLAEKMGKSESTIRGDISELAKMGLVSKESDGRRKKYVLKDADWLLQHLKWKEIASMVERRKDRPFSGSVEDKSEMEKCRAVDPITNNETNLTGSFSSLHLEVNNR